jgi:hypothetical protein
MTLEVIAVGTLAVIAVIAIIVASRTRLRSIYLESVFAATYVLAGHLSMESDDDHPGYERMDDHEFNAAIILLLDALSDPDGASAKCLVEADPSASYEKTLARSVRKSDAADACDEPGCECKNTKLDDVGPV